jgi:hypothetical protein
MRLSHSWGALCLLCFRRLFRVQGEHLKEDHAEIVRRIYRGRIDRPKATRLKRLAALSPDTLIAIEVWVFLSRTRTRRRPRRLYDFGIWSAPRIRDCPGTDPRVIRDQLSRTQVSVMPFFSGMRREFFNGHLTGQNDLSRPVVRSRIRGIAMWRGIIFSVSRHWRELVQFG